MKQLFTLFAAILSAQINLAQSVTEIPDSVSSASRTGSTANWNFSNPMNHNGTSYTNPGMIVCMNCRSNYLFLQKCGFSIPTSSTILGVEVKYQRAGCNSGSFVNDTISLASAGTGIGNSKFTYTPDVGATDTLGGTSDTWSASLTPVIVNSDDFGIRIHVKSTGICTYGVFDVRITVFFSTTTGIIESQTSPSLRVFPNPAHNYFSVSSEQADGYTLYSPQGEWLQSGKLNSGINHFNMNVPRGMYILKTTSGQVQKIVIE